MQRQRTIFIACGVAAVAALAFGCVMIAFHGFTPPDWLLRGEVAIFSGIALVGGFTAFVPAVMPWMRLRPVRGAALVIAGVAAVYVPAQFIASAVLLTLGIRLVWAEACELADGEREPEAAGTAIIRAGMPNGPPATREPSRARGLREAEHPA
jgi:hypothetical protein